MYLATGQNDIQIWNTNLNKLVDKLVYKNTIQKFCLSSDE